MTLPTSPPHTGVSLVRGLGLLAATSIVIGDVIGTGVFLKTRVMTCNVGTPGMVIAVWVIAGLLSVAGALTYAELAARFPRSGGEYVFIREGYGPLWGFLYGWTRFFVATSGSTAGLAAGFAIFINVLAGHRLDDYVWHAGLFGAGIDVNGLALVAIASIAVTTIINCAAIDASGRVALVMTALKVVLVVGVGLVAMLLAQGSWSHLALSAAGGTCEGVPDSARGGIAGFGAAMLGALWAYNGWNEVTYVGEEIKDPQRNLPIAIVGGIGIIAVLYIFSNASYFYALTPAEIASVPASGAVATEAVMRALGSGAAGVMAAAMAISIFGALQVATLVCARIPYAMARDGVFFSALGHVNPATRVPIRAVVAQNVWSMVLVLSGSYDALTDYSIFIILIFVALATMSIFTLRRRAPADSAYRMWGYPVVPVIFTLVAGWLIVNTLIATPGRAMAGLGLMACGLPFYWYWTRTLNRSSSGGMS